MKQHEKIDYIEFPTTDLAATKNFFSTVFDWQFVDYGPEYSAFSNAGIDGGFFVSDKTSRTDRGSTLVVLYSNDIQATQSKIEHGGGAILKPIFSFPGGQRFHFADPGGSEYAVWSESTL